MYQLSRPSTGIRLSYFTGGSASEVYKAKRNLLLLAESFQYLDGSPFCF
jgi:hypothetical protein